MSAFLKDKSITITEYEKQLIRRLIEKVGIFEDKYTMEFKSGMMVDVNK